MALDITSYLLGKLSGGGGGANPQQVEAAYDACEDKGATIPEEKTLANLADCIETIPGQIVIPPEAGTLVSLVVGTLPKVAYVEDDPLDLSGMVILGNYSNGGQYDVTPNCTITANNPVLYTDTKIVVSLDGVTLDIPITVTGKPVKAPDNTIVLYHLDGDLKSALPNGADATCASTVYTTGKFGTTITNTSNNTFASPDFSKTETDIASGSFTIEYWCSSVTTSSNMKTGDLFTCCRYSSSSWIVCDSATYRLSLNNTLRNSGTETYYATIDGNNPGVGKWKHIALTIDRGDYYIFYNGRLMTKGKTKTPTSGAPYRLNFVCSNNYCVFDEVMACNEAKYVADFEPPHGPYYIEE